jgi:hypothetical protein
MAAQRKDVFQTHHFSCAALEFFAFTGTLLPGLFNQAFSPQNGCVVFPLHLNRWLL